MSNGLPSRIKPTHIGAAIALAALMALASGCDDGEGTETRTGPPPAERLRADTVRECPTRIEGPRLRPGPDDVVAGPIVFYGLRDAANDPSYYREIGRGRYQSFKTVTEVEANAVVTVAVPPGERDLALNYIGRLPFIARLSDLDRTVEFRACASSHLRFSGRGRVGPRTQFNGGFTSAGPGCRTFYVFPGQDAEPIQLRLGFGTRRRTC